MPHWPMPGAPLADWRAPPARPGLADGEVHVWRARLDAGTTSARSVLSSDERARASRFRFETDRARWTAARVLLRSVLARYLSPAPEELVFATGERDKPALVGGDGSLRFNLSHSGALAVVGVARGQDVGVDVEVVRGDRDLLQIARRVLDADLVEGLEGAAPGERPALFFPAWVRHEAAVKCRGSGLVEPPGDPEGVVVFDLDVGAGYAAALAVEAEPHIPLLWEWVWGTQ